MSIHKNIILGLVAGSVFVTLDRLALRDEGFGVRFTSPVYGQSAEVDEVSSFRGRTKKDHGKTVISYEWLFNHPGGKVYRKFTDASGKHTTDACLVELDVSKAEVRLLKRSGKEVVLPIEKLSEADRMWVINEQKRRLLWSWQEPEEEYPVQKLLRTRVEIDEWGKDAVIASFGAPHIWHRQVETEAQNDWDKAKKYVAMRRKLSERGMEYSIIDRSLKIDYRWMVDQSRDDLKQLTRDLFKLGKSKGLATQRDYIRLFASFVQHMRYEIPELNYEHSDHGLVYTAGVWMPLESLYRGCGDCDTKSALFASMMANVPGAQVVFMLGEGHAFVGIRGVPRRGDRFVNLRGAKYILAELTYPWPIGQIPTQSWQHTQRGALVVVKVVGEEK